MKSDSIRKNLAEIFISALEEDPLNWSKGFISNAIPENGVYHSKYKMHNRFFLMYIMKKRGYTDPRFYPQSYIFGSPQNRKLKWDDPKKIKVIKGEKPVLIETSFFCPKKEYKEEHNLSPISVYEYLHLPLEETDWYFPVRKDIPVYNAEQLTGIPKRKEVEQLKLTEKEKHQAINKAIKEMNVEVIEDQLCDVPHYKPHLDIIVLPSHTQFDNESHYVGVKLHELAHATGADFRLNRQITNVFGTPEYAIEELRAEIASTFMSAEFGFNIDGVLNNHKAYVQNWAEVISKDVNVLINAISSAEKIADYIEEKAGLEIYKKIEIEDINNETDRNINLEDEQQPKFSTSLDNNNFNKQEKLNTLNLELSVENKARER